MGAIYKRLISEKGLAAVEFAIVIPLLLILIMSVVEFSWYSLTYIRAEQCTREVARNVRPPSDSIIYQEQLSGVWNMRERGIKPTWLSQSERAAWSFDNYDGWLSFGAPANENEIAGILYFIISGDRKEDFSERLRSSLSYLDPDRFSYQIRGGWYVKSMGPGMPSSGDMAWKATWSVDRSRQYYADVVVESVYRYKPFSPVGRIMLGLREDGIREIKVKEHCQYSVGEVWRH